MNKLKRICFICGNSLFYQNRKTYLRAIKKNTSCKTCSLKNRKIGKMSEEHKNKIRQHHLNTEMGKWMIGRKLSINIRNKISDGNKGKIRSEESKKKYSESKLGDKNPAKKFSVRLKISNTLKSSKRIISEETRRKLSIKSKQVSIKRLGILGKLNRPNFNPKGCEYFDKLSQERGWNLKHAMNGGEKRILCYYIDGYDEDRNIVIEYDEPKHYDIYGQLIEADKKRMKDIMNHLNCRFFRYKESDNLLYEVTKV